MALTSFGTRPRPRCFVRAYRWPASARSCVIGLRNDRSLRQGRLRSPFGDRAAVAGGVVMLIAHVERYVRLRQTLGFKLRDASRALRAFATFAAARGDTSLRESTAVAWAAEAPSPNARSIRLRIVDTWLASCTPRTRSTRSRRRICSTAQRSDPCRTSTHPRRWCRSSRRPVESSERTHSDARCTRRCSG